MAEQSQNAMLFQKDEEKISDSAEESKKCTKLNLPENIDAFLKKETLDRQEVEPLTCNSSIVDNVVLNYIIVKKILSNMSWQDKVICRLVCTTWYSAVEALKKEQLYPHDYAVDFSPCSTSSKTCFRKSGNFVSEPLLVMSFVNIPGFSLSSHCKNIEPHPCLSPCQKEHSLLDVIHQATTAPKDCHVIVRADSLCYMPIPTSKTYRYTLTRLRTKPFIAGLYIPAIPHVKFHTINIKTIENISTDFFESTARIARDEIIKGVLVFVNDKFLLHSVEDIIFLNYFRDVQPDIPYALGGCIVDDTVLEYSDFNSIVNAVNTRNDFVSETLVTIGMFTIPKNPVGEEYNFDMFSFILKSSEWGKTKIEQAITEFSNKIPRFEHSAVIKLSCVGRNQKHKFEQECFRSSFPNSRIVGCYGNGELGLSHPEPTLPDEPENSVKKSRQDSGPQFGIMYSYSSVFMYIGWGKKLTEGGPVKK